jgi:lipooligosaccharide transport system permease protein
MATTPLRPADLVRGHLLWLSLRLTVACTAVMVALQLFPSVRDPGLVPAVPCAALSGVAAGMVMLGVSAHLERDTAFVSVQRFVVIPLFLFGGAFFPVSQLPTVVQALVKVFPLWHGTELCRGLVDSSLTAAEACVHVLYLLVW